jgi:hypothetical protein
MGKSVMGVFGNVSGKVGNVNFRTSQGRTIESAYRAHISNPRTAKQVAAREQFAAYSQNLAKFAPVAADTAKGWYRPGNSFSNLFKGNYPDLIVEAGGQYEADWSKLILSKGNGYALEGASASEDNGNISCSWTYDSVATPLNGDDPISIVAYNSAKDICVYGVGVAKRSDNQATLTMPATFSGDNVEVYIFAKSVTTGEYNNSAYLGSISL